MNNRMEIQIAALAVNESFARSAVAAFIAYLDPTLEELTEIKTGVSEAVSNAIIHGYEEGEEGIILIECSIGKKGKVLIRIKDEGVGIGDIDKARQPMFTTGKAEERSGMGFTVMESFMDKLEVESERGIGTTVTMTKFLDAVNGE
ncbi:MAG: anti-sigma F factor [Anaerovoracaceae bacterium]